MTSIWAESLQRTMDESLDLLRAAVEACADDLWVDSMWTVDPGQPPAYSAPWLRAWHALEVVDYDLSGELEPWKPPPPFEDAFTGDTSRIWTRDEILGYLEYCRHRFRDTLEHMTDERAATPLPPQHRYRGHPHAWHVVSLPAHTVEHAMQIQQFVNDARRQAAKAENSSSSALS